MLSIIKALSIFGININTVPNISLLIRNIRSYAIIDMADADYTMTDEQASAALKFITGTGDGSKSLLVPTSASAIIPSSSTIVMAIGTNKVSISPEAGGEAAVFYALNGGATTIDTMIFTPFGCYSQAYYDSVRAAETLPGIRTVTDDEEITLNDMGVMVEMDAAIAKAFNFSDANVALMKPGARGKLRMTGIGVTTITASGTATVTGVTTLAQYDIVNWYRRGTTNDIIIGFG